MEKLIQKKENNDQLFDSYLKLLGEMIKNGCVNTGHPDSGNEFRSVKTLESFFSSHGLKAEIFTPREGRPSLLLTLPGTNPDYPTLMLMGHLDVVPADSSKWKYSPFKGEIAEGRLWGRGALDMLGQTAVMAAVTADIFSSGEKYPGTLKYLAIADEEAAGTYGARYLVDNHWEKVKTDFMLTELGGFYLDLPGTPTACFTIGEKGVTQVRLKASGQASHGSLPFGAENAAMKLAEGMTRIGKHPPVPEVGGLFSRIVEELNLSSDIKADLLDPAEIDAGLKSLAEKSPGSSRILHACSRMTVSPNYMEAGSKVNIIPGSGFMELDIRTLPGQDDTAWDDYLKDVLGDLKDEYEIEVIESCRATISEPDSPLMKACKETVKSADSETALIPMLTTVATDGRFWRERGTVVYGFSHYHPELTVDRAFSMIHGPNESVSLESLRRQLDFYRRIPENFFKAINKGRNC